MILKWSSLGSHRVFTWPSGNFSMIFKRFKNDFPCYDRDPQRIFQRFSLLFQGSSKALHPIFKYVSNATQLIGIWSSKLFHMIFKGYSIYEFSRAIFKRSSRYFQVSSIAPRGIFRWSYKGSSTESHVVFRDRHAIFKYSSNTFQTMLSTRS